MRLIVGLGNPGDDYAHTRHNAGFDAIDDLAEQLRATYWKTECGALTAKVKYRGEELILAKQQSYMNVSGGPVKQLCATYRIAPADIVVIHDELDIDPGTVRVKFGGGLAGHNGLKSIADKLQTKDRSPSGTHACCGLGFEPSEKRGARRFRPGHAFGGRSGAVLVGKRPGENPAAL